MKSIVNFVKLLVALLIISNVIFIIYMFDTFKYFKRHATDDKKIDATSSSYSTKYPRSMSAIKLENIQSAQSNLQNGKNIFFIDSMRMRIPYANSLGVRQLCSIESAARSNPHLNVNVILITPKESYDLQMKSQLAAVLSYSNVNFLSLNPVEFALETPYEIFMEKDELSKSVRPIEHSSDIFRLLLLWRYGGTYLDLDFIVTAQLDKINNYACDDGEGSIVANGLINLDQKFGKKFAKTLMNEQMKNWNGSLWGHNGPLLLTRVLSNLCNTTNIDKMVALGNCDGFHVLKKSICYPIPHSFHKYFFTEQHTDQLLRRITDETISVHFWNGLTKDFLVQIHKKSPFMILAKKFCPRVIAATEFDF